MLASVSLLSQLVPQHPVSVLTVGIAAAASPTIPTVAPPDVNPRVPGRGVVDATALMHTLLADGPDTLALARLEAAVDEHVDVWTPALHTTSRFQLMSSLTRIDDAITDVSVTVTESFGSDSTAALVWLASGRFSRPALLDDDHLLEPSGVVIRAAGTLTVSFTANRRADRIRCFYDRLGIVEQLYAASAAGLGH
jgi:hypothetical protein